MPTSAERKLKILQAIISDYVKTAEPVGSRTLSKRIDMNISPATIRNEMSDLEDMGYLAHPHTSARRIPSDKAYRLYVNRLMEKPEISIDVEVLLKVCRLFHFFYSAIRLLSHRYIHCPSA